MLPAAVNLGAIAGDTLRLDFQILDVAGLPVSLVGMGIVFVASRTEAGLVDATLDGGAVLSSAGSDANVTITLTDASNGQFRAEAEAPDTADLRGTYDYRVYLDDVSNDRSTPIGGVLTFEV